MISIVKNVSEEQYSHIVNIYYPDPLDGQKRQALQGEMKRILRDAKISDYKLLDKNNLLTVGFKSQEEKDRFYKSFDKGISNLSLCLYFGGKRTTPTALGISNPSNTHDTPEPA